MLSSRLPSAQCNAENVRNVTSNEFTSGEDSAIVHGMFGSLNRKLLYNDWLIRIIIKITVQLNLACTKRNFGFQSLGCPEWCVVGRCPQFPILCIFFCFCKSTYQVQYKIQRIYFVFISEAYYSSSRYTIDQQPSRASLHPSTLFLLTAYSGIRLHIGIIQFLKNLALIWSLVWL